MNASYFNTYRRQSYERCVKIQSLERSNQHELQFSLAAGEMRLAVDSTTVIYDLVDYMRGPGIDGHMTIDVGSQTLEISHDKQYFDVIFFSLRNDSCLLCMVVDEPADRLALIDGLETALREL